MAHFKAEPKVHLVVEGLNLGTGIEFEKFLRSGALPVERLGRGYVGYLDVPDAEKVVEWLKAHGVEPRK